jgi:HSP20 family protein
MPISGLKDRRLEMKTNFALQKPLTPATMLAPIASLRREMDRLWDELNANGWTANLLRDDAVGVRMDVAETEKEIQITADLPGVDLKDLDISLANDILTIHGERKSERDEQKANFHLIERSFGQFTRKIAVPEGCDPAQVKADFTNGVLKIAIAKPAETIAPPHKIKITKS